MSSTQPGILLEELSNALGSAAVLRGDAVPARYQTDWSGLTPVCPLALLRPSSTIDVSAALRICHAHRVAVVPQGGLTGLAGAAMPVVHGVALSLERMNAIEPIDSIAASVTVQAGATLQAVQEAARSADLLFGVDLGARGSCQIGGNLATNAGGNGVLQFGMMREQVLGLEVVLADGTVLPMMRPMLKNNTGYDLKQWFIGSEGTLGVITGAILRLHPLPRARVSTLIGLPDYASALRLLQQLQQHFPGSLAAFELMWQDFFTTSLGWSQMASPLSRTGQFTVLAEVTGMDEVRIADGLQTVLADAMEAGVVLDAVVAQSQAQAGALWRIREATAEFPTRLLPINFDISLPNDQIGDFADECKQVLSQRWETHHTLRFGHLGDSNLHITVDARSLNGPLTLAQKTHDVEQLIYTLVAARGGSISAEHGIGLHKKPYLSLSRSAEELVAMQAIKRALDPLNLLNPGKVFDIGQSIRKANMTTTSAETLERLARPDVQTLPAYNAGLSSNVVRQRYGVSQVARLASNENPFGPSPAVASALTGLAKEVALYPDAHSLELRTAIAERTGTQASHVVIGNGSENLLEMLCQTLLSPGDLVVTLVPSFGLHEIYPRMMGAQVKMVPVTPELEFDVDAWCQVLEQGTQVPKLVMFSNPSNPVGCMLDADAFRRIVQATPPETMLVIDEAYYEYARHSPGFPDALSELRRQKRPWIVLRTFSKAWGLAGLRVGYGIASDASLVKLLDRVRTPFNVNIAAQIAALAAWNDSAHMERTVRDTLTCRDVLSSQLRGLGVRVAPSAGNFLFLDLQRPNGDVTEGLLASGILVKPWKESGYETFLRVSVGTCEDNAWFVQALEEILHSLRGKTSLRGATHDVIIPCE